MYSMRRTVSQREDSDVDRYNSKSESLLLLLLVVYVRNELHISLILLWTIIPIDIRLIPQLFHHKIVIVNCQVLFQHRLLENNQKYWWTNIWMAFKSFGPNVCKCKVWKWFACKWAIFQLQSIYTMQSRITWK